MNRTNIEWTDYTVNPIKGLCKGGCIYCYARKMYKRFKWNPKVRLDFSVLPKINKLKKPSRIFICSTHDIMGAWIPDSWIMGIVFCAYVYPQHTFQFLTKNPKRYADFNFPKNCWLGTTATQEYQENVHTLFLDKSENIKFISFEPLTARIAPYYYSRFIIGDFAWFIVGGLTPQPVHKKEWVEDIIKVARTNNIPIFLKDNLHWPEKIQEFPK